MKKKNIILTIIASLVAVIVLVVAIPFIVLGAKTASLSSDYAYLQNDSHYSTKVEVKDIKLVKQHVSCGYATIEMMSTYYGNKVSEEDLDNRNKSISTSSSNGFLKEVNKSISSQSFVMKRYLKDDELLKEIHDALSNNHPVAIEWAAKYDNEWTLHFSLVTALDIATDSVKINNPYGYVENITINEFLNRTSFKAYQNIPLFLNFGFAFGAFDKNTIFYAQ